MSTNDRPADSSRPSDERARLARAISSSAPLDLVAEGIAAATEYPPLLVYVERRGRLYRWSPAHRGGPYPLLRVWARFLQVDHHSLVLPFRTVDGVCIVTANDDDQSPPDDSSVLDFSETHDATRVRERIRLALG